jgi:Flp pilus assembly protein TadG
MKQGKRRGSILVEFALVLPIFLVLVLGIIETASLFQQFQVVQYAAREGARLAAVGETASTVTSTVTGILATRSFAGTPTIVVSEIPRSTYVESQVSVSVQLQTITPLGNFVPAFAGSFSPTAVAKFRKEG